MRIQLITPAPAHTLNGNRVTAVRWARILRQLGHRIAMERRYDGQRCDLMIALHARRSFDSIRRFRNEQPDLPLIVVLTGTDLYRDILTNSHAQESLELATRLIILQPMGMAELPRQLQSKTRVIYQSAERVDGKVTWAKRVFRVCVIGHFRPEKDPFRTALAARQLPATSRVRVLHIGRGLSDIMKRRARHEEERNPRYRWLGELPHWKTRRLLAMSHLLVLTSRIEGSSNVLSEAIASSVPVIASRISGLIGTLGEGYPGYFPVGDTSALAHLLLKAESDPQFYDGLKAYCARLLPLVDPERERASWQQLLAELK